jgi:hypothetical protein
VTKKFVLRPKEEALLPPRSLWQSVLEYLRGLLIFDDFIVWRYFFNADDDEKRSSCKRWLASYHDAAIEDG